MATNLAAGVDAALASILSDTATWRGANIHLGALEKQLTHLWGDTNKDNGSGKPVTRTRVLNLICVTDSSDRAARIKETVSQMGGQHPSRTIIVVAHPEMEDQEANLDAEIEAHRLRTNRESGDVSWELVTVSARGRTAFHLASVVTPLLITDLPTFMWWSGEPPFESELFSRLLGISDRAMVDSLSFRPPFEKDVQRLAKLVKKWGNEVAISDFNWARIRPWVEATIQVFDTAANRTFLDGIERVNVEYEAHSEDPDPNPSQAILYMAWLSSRLGWQPEKGRKRTPHGGWQLPMASPTVDRRTVALDVKAVDSRTCGIGEIARLVIECRSMGRNATIEVGRSQDKTHATTTLTVEGSAPLAKTVEFEKTNDGSLLLEELNIFDRDRAYEGALEMASAILGGGKVSKGK